jgi:SAM-dependent methyltransferase
MRFVQDQLKNMHYFCIDFGSYKKKNQGNTSAPIAPRFAESSYWDERYLEKDSAFEWIFSTAEAMPFIDIFVPKSSNVLMIGCGNSKLTESMYREGWKKLTSIDYSPACIRQQAKRSTRKRLKCRWLVMDVRRLRFPNCSFDAVVDKGTADNLLCYKNTEKNMAEMLREIYRCLKPGGLYLIFSLNKPCDILELAIDHPKMHWAVSQSQLRNKQGMLQTVLVFKKLEGLLPLPSRKVVVLQQPLLPLAEMDGKSISLLRTPARCLRQQLVKALDSIEQGSTLKIGQEVDTPNGRAHVVGLPPAPHKPKIAVTTTTTRVIEDEGSRAVSTAMRASAQLMYQVELGDGSGRVNMQRRLLRRLVQSNLGHGPHYPLRAAGAGSTCDLQSDH